MPTTASSLLADLDVAVETNAPIGRATWYGIGGRADLLVRPNSVEALATIVRRCARSRMPVRVLGAGANLLVADEGADGIVLRLDTPAFTEVRYNARGAVEAMRAGAGADLPKLLMDTVRRGLDGLTFMAGIPASVGGAVHMNAGGAFGAIGDSIHSVACLSSGGDVRVYPREELRFGYRRTNIPDPIIIWAAFTLRETDPLELRERVKAIFAYKKSTQPLADHSAGCTFRNPVDPVTEQRVAAGRLIDEAGLKGLTVGGATVSDRHANFIVTAPGASATDVLRLMETIRRRVLEHSGYELEPEVAIWRRGEEGDL